MINGKTENAISTQFLCEKGNSYIKENSFVLLDMWLSPKERKRSGTAISKIMWHIKLMKHYNQKLEGGKKWKEKKK